jgi:hypothetical protein
METSWTTTEDGERILIVHDDRWLAIIGIPMMLFGLAVAIGPWFIDEARHSGAWPILAVGSLIGAGLIVAGLSLCFKYEEIAADRGTGVIVRHIGLDPFRRTKTRPLSDFTEVACLDERTPSSSRRAPSLVHRVRLIGPDASEIVTSSVEAEPIRVEAQRWANFLELPLRDTLGSDPETQLRDSFERYRPTGRPARPN